LKWADQHDLPPLPYTPWHDTAEYSQWIQQFDTLSPSTVAEMQTTLEQWSYRPMISILMPIADANWLQRAIESVQKQIYPDFELLLIHQDFVDSSVKKTDLLAYTAIDQRIKLIEAPKTLAMALNHALATGHGEFLALMGGDDQLPSQALYKIVETLNADSETDLIYTDSDKLNAQQQRCDPYFKSDWNPDLFYSQNFIRHLAVYRRRLVDDIGGFRSDYPGSEDYDLALRMIERIDEARIRHIRQILYHQSSSDSSSVKNTAIQALQAHFERLGQSVNVVDAIAGHTRVIYPLPNQPPLVSIIIPTRDQLKLLRGTVNGLLNQTDYKNIEIIIIDNGSVESETLDYLTNIQKNRHILVIRDAAPFNYSRLNNLGVSHANGEIIGLMNNDLEMISDQWLTEMVSHALRAEIGAVGAKLYYTNNTIQHAGVIVGLGGMAGHGFKFLAKEASGYYWRPFLIQNYSAVTAACLMMRRQVFEQVGGLEEKHLKVAFNDVDLCLRIREHGYRIVWTPYAELYHLESASRGMDDTPAKFWRLQQELKYMKSRWGETLSNDPYYNPNLTREYEDFSLEW
jgi:GT2 family glycosyltransferase